MDSLRRRIPPPAVRPKNLPPRPPATTLPEVSLPPLRPQRTLGPLHFDPPPPRKWGRFLFFLFIALFSLALLSVIYFSWKISAVSQKIVFENKSSFSDGLKTIFAPLLPAQHSALDGEAEGRINILLLGIAGEKNAGRNLTDTIMILSLNTRSKKIALLSLPRDLYVSVPQSSYTAKINSIYQYGLNSGSAAEPLRQTVEKITGQKMHYYLVLDYAGFTRIVDDIHGITVNVERDFFDPRYPGPNYSYETFEIKKGVQHLDGATALKFVRERHADPQGDFGRAKRQQQVLQATKNKVFSLGTVLNVLTLNRILNDMGEHIRTNIQLAEIESFIWWSQQVDTQNITTTVADAWKKDSLLKVSHVATPNGNMFILIPRAGSWSEIEDLAGNIFDLEALQKRRAEIEAEQARILLINQSADSQLATKTKALLEKLGMRNVAISRDKTSLRRADTIVQNRAPHENLFTLDEILKKLPARLATQEIADESATLAEEPTASPSRDTKNNDILPKDSEQAPDIIVTLGADLVDIYQYEEDTMEELNQADESNF